MKYVRRRRNQLVLQPGVSPPRPITRTNTWTRSTAVTSRPPAQPPPAQPPPAQPPPAQPSPAQPPPAQPPKPSYHKPTRLSLVRQPAGSAPPPQRAPPPTQRAPPPTQRAPPPQHAPQRARPHPPIAKPRYRISRLSLRRLSPSAPRAQAGGQRRVYRRPRAPPPPAPRGRSCPRLVGRPRRARPVLTWRAPSAAATTQPRNTPADGVVKGIGARRAVAAQKKPRRPRVGNKLVRRGSKVYAVAMHGTRSKTLVLQNSTAEQQQASPRANAARLLLTRLLRSVPASASVTSASGPRRCRPTISAAAAARRRSLLHVRTRKRRATLRVCSTFLKTGVCTRHKAGKCLLEHDPAKVAVCTKWLHGDCEDKGCTLQHMRRPELMPVCMYFLKGICVDDCCPYLHVNLDSDAPVCVAFQEGYCPEGTRCMKRHLSARQIKELKASHHMNVKHKV